MQDKSKIFLFGAILILGMLGLSQNAFAGPLTLFQTSFVDSFLVGGQETSPSDVAFSSDGAKMFVVGIAGDAVNEYTLGTAFDVSTATFVGSFSVGGQEISPRGLSFSSDGTKMFVVGNNGDDVNEYTLGTAFDVSTATFVDSFSVAVQEDSPQGVAFSSDGVKMFVVGSNGDAVNEYTLGTAFDVSTASYNGTSFSVGGGDTIPTGVAFSSDGAKMFVIGDDGNDVNEYTLGTAFDVSTATFVGSFSVEGQESRPQGVAFSSDGAKMFVIGFDGDAVHEYTLGTAFDVSTASYNGTSFSVALQERNPQGVAFSSDGAKMFVIGFDGIDVNEYTLGTAFDVSTATFVDSFSVEEQEASPRGLAFSSDGAKMFVIGFDGDDVNEYTLGTAFDVSTATFVDSFSVGGQESNPQGVAFSSDGAKMFVVGFAGNDVNEYTLGTEFDVSTATFVDSFSVGGQEVSPRGVAFSSDGAKMFVVGTGGDAVYEYTLSTPFGVSTATFVGSFSVAGQETSPSGVAFSSDGAKMFVVGSNGDAVYEYSLATSFTLFHTTFVDSFSVAGQETSPEGVAFSSDGAKMFVVGTGGDAVFEYAFFTPFDVSTAFFFGNSFSVAGQEDSPQGVAFSPDGAKMFVIGDDGNDVNEYTLGTAFDVSTATFSNNSFSVGGEEINPQGVAFSSDGAKMFVVGFAGDDVNEYTLGTEFDVSTAIFVDSFSVAGQEASPRGLSLSSDGVKMFVVGSNGDAVYEYTLGTAFDVSTATFVGSFSVAGQDTSPSGVAFSSDGVKMFVVGSNGDAVYEYNLPSCSPPSLGNWVVNTSCTMIAGATINNGDLVVQNNSVLTVPFTLDIDFSSHKITIESGSGVLIKSGGAIT